MTNYPRPASVPMAPIQDLQRRLYTLERRGGGSGGSTDSGAASGVTSAGGALVVPHSLGVIPTSVVATSQSVSYYVVANNFTATDFRIIAVDPTTGAIVPSTPILVSWAAYA